MRVPVLLAGAVLVLAGCGSSGGSGSGGAYGGGDAAATTTTAAPASSAGDGYTAPAGGASSGGAAASGGEQTLVASGFKFDKTAFSFKAGDKVTIQLTNKDTAEHNFTFSEAKADQDVEGGEDAKVSFTAPAAGTYQFMCKYHPGSMKGTITVT
jgi:plastocyanin